MTTTTISIGGMTCVNCRNRIEQKLQTTAGVENAAVDYIAGTASITWDSSVVTLAGLKAAIETLGYTVGETKAGTSVPFREVAGIAVLILALYVLVRGLGINAAASAFPLAETSMSYGMLLVIGLITSVHCTAMCGGINLSQTLGRGGGALRGAEGPPQRGEAEKRSFGAGGETSPLLIPQSLFPAILYNAGRVISYTFVGVLAGALGSVVNVSGRFQGMVQLIAGVFMVIMGINMLGFFPGLRRFVPRLPGFLAKKTGGQKLAGKSPLIVGLLNGLMPCGPLQAMQIYALSTGNPIAGGLSMFLFSMGTVPLMFGLGALSTLLSGKFTRTVMKVGAILVTVMGLTMFSYGWNLGGLPNPLDGVTSMASSRGMAGRSGSNVTAGSGVFVPVIENGVQIVNSSLAGGRYPAITVQQGIPVKWTINAPAGSINGCNNRMIIREYGIEYRFKPGENVIEFTPEKTGRVPFSCWMGMISSTITVVAEGERIADVQDTGLLPSPAGVSISIDSIAVAELAETRGSRYQAVTTNLRDEGISPAVIVVQRNIPVLWTINNDSLDPGNNQLIFPAFYQRLDMDQGDNDIQLMPVDDFDFSTADNVFYGYVKVVDDSMNVDMEAVKAEVSEFETLIYPEAYFGTAAGGSGAGCACCN